MEPAERLSLQHALSVFRNYVEEALDQQQFYSVAGYGWADFETVDPASYGHALWQTSPPAQPHWEVILNGGAPRTQTTTAQEKLAIYGEDFTGAMIAARHHAGLALSIQNTTDPAKIDEDGHYWTYIASSILWLGIASERIRDYFVLAVFQQTIRECKARFGGRVPWAHPFAESIAVARNRDESTLLGQLLPFVDSVQRRGDTAIESRTKSPPAPRFVSAKFFVNNVRTNARGNHIPNPPSSRLNSCGPRRRASLERRSAYRRSRT